MEPEGIGYTAQVTYRHRGIFTLPLSCGFTRIYHTLAHTHTRTHIIICWYLDTGVRRYVHVCVQGLALSKINLISTNYSISTNSTDSILLILFYSTDSIDSTDSFDSADSTNSILFY